MEEGPILVRPAEDWPAPKAELQRPPGEGLRANEEEITKSFFAFLIEPIWVMFCLMVAAAVLHANGRLTFRWVMVGLGIVAGSIVLRMILSAGKAKRPQQVGP